MRFSLQYVVDQTLIGGDLLQEASTRSLLGGVRVDVAGGRQCAITTETKFGIFRKWYCIARAILGFRWEMCQFLSRCLTPFTDSWCFWSSNRRAVNWVASSQLFRHCSQLGHCCLHLKLSAFCGTGTGDGDVPSVHFEQLR